MADFEIHHETSNDQGRFVICKDGDEAELTFTRRSPGVVSADHTGVPDSFHGTGAGKALVEALVKDARENGYRIVPLCTFVDAMRRRHPEWADQFTS
ncbi:N-acetyltransferase [Xinfangfangia sp. D13-10-4-6]|uniref:GNAT family N-acetyltransferase n=1 Tax=Pseudogemmobacter hezensis TaxID=2737662 RepID=UPI001556218F|nr:GNAT family N-acetyltransferase [Pseudogemmobacter hezensis]NPD15291.1 N-acetyltransferase [Pseudogemmobacter hezensis]